MVNLFKASGLKKSGMRLFSGAPNRRIVKGIHRNCSFKSNSYNFTIMKLDILIEFLRTNVASSTRLTWVETERYFDLKQRYLSL
ncbi:hypothetical protein KUTeg_009313 [Tegillarca granosa]|uniref:Ribosomal protein L20 n=1 Tax=Tegillarca granosa TaxID=220873 RepID=A0ABQ9FBB1_TEGGR|nr:hypothetical protein KUTeg_009313 [Tegillarca granosa]